MYIYIYIKCILFGTCALLQLHVRSVIYLPTKRNSAHFKINRRRFFPPRIFCWNAFCLIHTHWSIPTVETPYTKHRVDVYKARVCVIERKRQIQKERKRERQKERECVRVTLRRSQEVSVRRQHEDEVQFFFWLRTGFWVDTSYVTHMNSGDVARMTWLCSWCWIVSFSSWLSKTYWVRDIICKYV